MWTRFISWLVKLLLRILAHAKPLGGVDLAGILSDNTETLLNLPGRLPFFATRITDPDRVRALFQKLHPVTCSRELIRLGPDGDGGYLVPNDLDGIEACFSPGVNTISGFERDCADMGMKVFMADASVNGPPEQHPAFSFIKKFIGATSGGDFITLSDWVSESLPPSHSDLLLQIDIEGCEYESLLSTPGALMQRFRIIVVEFHYLDHLFSAPLFAIYSKVFDRLLDTHTCVHIHPNNVCPSLMVKGLEVPQMAEFTFLRNDRVVNLAFATEFPHPLDRDNTNKVSVRLPASCYSAR